MVMSPLDPISRSEAEIIPLFLGSEIEVVDNDTHPLIEAVIRLTTPPCVFTVQELQIGCDNDQLCVSRCGEMLEVCVLFIFR